MDPTQYQFDPFLSIDNLPSWPIMDQTLFQNTKSPADSDAFVGSWSQLGTINPSPTEEDYFDFNLISPSSLEGDWTALPTYPSSTIPSTPSLSASHSPSMTSVSSETDDAPPFPPPTKRRRGRPRSTLPKPSNACKPSPTCSGRTPHKYVEQKYRHSVTAAFQNLQNVVFPQLDDRDRTGFGRLSPTKTAILIQAREYIQQLERQNARLQETVEELKDAMP
ncbi:hypothetical protein P152DRAFT_79648 [Eremomyces bilateralis CBS 781.70]|uniref:BHLH domain-containing protein n=1 Tax=Eremomyces bilateralis CBS 781.70 TaxID=1392243 RepID=A0A6G1FZM3_9PEZI|nr:uncharacterized protein P152DRAFT_79648 [Eremomyces bilateralis CBS 781.70]KAF1811126.1 hypothetical protein P152DRAFT_79648 [Eremomyces bilateralis CBS 781.70]